MVWCLQVADEDDRVNIMAICNRSSSRKMTLTEISPLIDRSVVSALWPKIEEQLRSRPDVSEEVIHRIRRRILSPKSYGSN